MAQNRAARGVRANSFRANLAVGLAVATILLWIVLLAASAGGAMWLLLGLAGAITTFAGWRAGGGTLPTGRALAAMLVGAVVVALVLMFMVAMASIGEL